MYGFYHLLLKEKENDLSCLYLHADKLIFGGILSDYFIKELKKEIIFAFKSANEPFYWSVLETLNQYQKRLNKHEKVFKQNDGH